MHLGPLLTVVVLCCVFFSFFTESSPADSIRRLDGSTISMDEANSFAQKTLEAAHVTGAQLAVLDHGQLVWNAAFGLRHRYPDLSMHRDTTTWAASITKSVFATYVMLLVELFSDVRNLTHLFLVPLFPLNNIPAS